MGAERFDADVLVAGGGPTGLAVAIRAVQAGLSAVVLERRAGVLDKACGEGLMPGAVAELRDLGVRVDGWPLDGIRYVDGSWRAEATFGGRAGLGVRRLALHGALRSRAQALGVRWVQGRCDGIRQDAVSVWAGGLRGRWLVAADGIGSPIRRSLGLDLPPTGPARIGVRRHFAVAPRDRMVEVHWSRFGEAYVTPVGPQLVGVAILCARDRRPPRRAGVRPFEALLAEFGELRGWLGDAPSASSSAGAGPFERRVRRRVVGRVLLAGDAAGYVDPITGEGLRLGFDAARAAVACIAADRPQDYDAAWLRLSRRYRWMTRGLVSLANQPALRRLVVPGAAVLPGVMPAAVRALGAETQPFALPGPATPAGRAAGPRRPRPAEPAEPRPASPGSPMSITVRAPDLPVPPGDRARHWLGGNLVASHVFNAAGTMIPPLERMVMRTAHRMAHLADDEALSRDVTALCRQEAQHGVAHSRFDRVLVEQGFDVSRPVARLEATMAAMERWCSPQLCLSFCVAVEHIFACMGDYVLTTDAMTGAEPGHAALWEWHGLEELEHKSVLFRLYERAGRGWLHRQAGMAIAASIFAVWLATFLVTLLRADPEYSLQRHRRDRRAWTDAGGQTAGRLLLRYVWPYLQPGFHPDQTDHRELLAEAQRRLEARGLAA